MNSQIGNRFPTPELAMARALELAARGIGAVEPNPPVGAVILDANGVCIGEGFHQRYGGPHAEIEALRSATTDVRGSTMFVTLEPCCHFGKTPPCSKALIQAGIGRVIIAARDIAPHVSGGGIAELQAAGIEVEVGLLRAESHRLLGPFFHRMKTGRPWVHAKWAMTLDGKIAASTGHSQWISGPESRRTVHELRGRMDGILVGIGTALADDPLLTARPPGLRTPLRIVLDAYARLPESSQLLHMLDQAPLLICVSPEAPAERVEFLQQHGATILPLPFAESKSLSLEPLLDHLGAEKHSHLLIEGGSGVLGSFFDANLIDELHVFLAPKLVGGKNAPTPLAGIGLPQIPQHTQLEDITFTPSGSDIYLHARFPHSWE